MNIYAVTLHDVSGFNLYMPYYFTNEKNAYMYGEYKYRTDPDILSYKVEKLVDMNSWKFYKLK